MHAALAFWGTVPQKTLPLQGKQSMFDSATARRIMVDGQVRTADVHNPDLLAAMLAIPRERFTPSSLAGQAYSDSDIEIAPGRVLLKPMVLAKLIEAVDVRSTDHVLDVGCGFGYSSAVLARLAGSIVALEEDPALANEGKAVLAAVGTTGVTVATGPLHAGWPAAAPYDLIFLNGATEIVPDELGAQLKPDGRLACVFGRMPATKAMIYRVSEGRLVGRPAFDAAAPVLPGFVAPPAFVF
jgi:protein-L-isoaspartate(D-aspartate) O-methyltransferase